MALLVSSSPRSWFENMYLVLVAWMRSAVTVCHCGLYGGFPKCLGYAIMLTDDILLQWNGDRVMKV